MGRYSFETVLGQVSEDEMGHTQPHEHIYIAGTIDQIRCKEICINNFPASMEELKLYRRAGGKTIVDANPLATGRDALALRDLSRLTQVNIIASTGYHIPKFYPEQHWIWDVTAERLSDLFADEIENGMYQDGTWYFPEYRTDCKAGVVKAMIDYNGLKNPQTVKLLTAAGLAAKRTGTSLMLHTEGVDVLEAIDFLAGKLGIPEKKLLICHVDRQTKDYTVHEMVAKTGVYLEYDTITLFEFHNAASEIELLHHMIENGFLNQLLISTDPTTDRLKSYYGTVGMDYILTEFIPLLEQRGFSKEKIFQITHANPWAALSKFPGNDGGINAGL
ncbi:MAG: phosphotriesterase [Clostridiales bacterium]|nr:phosphotriesterase [Clostridiales bacterium]